VTHRFAKYNVNLIEFYDMMQLCIMQNFIVNFTRRETYLALDLVQNPVHEEESSCLLQPYQTTTTIIKIDYNSLKFTIPHYNSLKMTIIH
jgi:hypothetical protein